MEIWQIWIAAALVFIIVEIFTSGFAIACFSIGCIFAAIMAAFNLSLSWQLACFALGSFLAFIFIRPFILKMMDKKSKGHEVKTNMDNLIGRTAQVIEPIEEDGYGRVKIDGDDWKARSVDGIAIENGKKVIIISYESIILTVKEK